MKVHKYQDIISNVVNEIPSAFCQSVLFIHHDIVWHPTAGTEYISFLCHYISHRGPDIKLLRQYER